MCTNPLKITHDLDKKNKKNGGANLVAEAPIISKISHGVLVGRMINKQIIQ